MKRKFLKLQKKALLTVSLAAASSVAVPTFAAVDTAAAVTEIGANSAGIVAVGGALIALAATAVGIKWIKGTIFS